MCSKAIKKLSVKKHILIAHVVVEVSLLRKILIQLHLKESRTLHSFVKFYSVVDTRSIISNEVCHQYNYTYIHVCCAWHGEGVTYLCIGLVHWFQVKILAHIAYITKLHSFNIYIQ